MPESDTSPAPGHLLKRRSVLLGGLGAASTAALAGLVPGTAAAAPGTRPAADPAAIDFDFDTGNFHRDLITALGDSTGQTQDIGGMDASVIIWIQGVMLTAWFDALAPYHPTAVGVHTRLGRRPAAESATNRNKNIAALQATYRVTQALYPERKDLLRLGLIAVGMNPDDESEEPTSPVGIGNLVGRGAVRAHVRDGMNFLGTEGRRYHGKPFDDYTGYRPVNSAYRLVDPSRWQPAVGPHARRVGGGRGDKGIFIIQRFVTPQFGRVTPFTYRDPRRFHLAPPRHSDHTRRRDYQRSVDEILAASAGLTDRQKVTAEFFDNKFMGIGQSTYAAAVSHDLDLDSWIHLFFTSGVAQFDDLIAAWHQKIRYDAVRPFSAVRHVYGRSRVSAWGGPGKGTVHDMPAHEWTSFIPVGDHSEYPSGSTTLCAAEAQAARRFLGDDLLGLRHSVAAGGSATEPGHVPAAGVDLHYATWSRFVRDCAMSRVWAGVHFRKTVETSLAWGEQFGDMAHEFAQRHIRGEV